MNKKTWQENEAQKKKWREATARYAAKQKPYKAPLTPEQIEQRKKWRMYSSVYRELHKNKGRKPSHKSVGRAIELVYRMLTSRQRRREKSYYDADRACKLYLLKLATRFDPVWSKTQTNRK